MGGLTAAALLLPGTANAAFGDAPADTLVTNGPVYAIATSGDTTYLGGNFTEVGPRTGSGVGIDAETGQSVGLPQVSGGGGMVEAVANDGSGGYFIGGSFTHVGGLARSNLAHILADGTVDPNFDPDPDSGVTALAVSGGTLYAGGYFTTIAGQSRSRVAAFDASTGDLTSWDPSADNSVFSLLVSGATVYVGGGFTSIGGQTRSNLAAIDASTGDATSWDPAVGAGMVQALALSGNTLYFGGIFHSVGDQTRQNLAAVDTSSAAPTSWDPGNQFANIDALAIAGSTVYVGGNFGTLGGQSRNNLAAIDTSTGQATAWDPDANNQAYALALNDNTVYAGGMFASIGGVKRKNLAALDVATGEPTPWNPKTNSDVDSLAVSGSTVYVGGAFSSVDGHSRGRIAAVDGSTGTVSGWRPEANGNVEALAISGSTVYAGGTFTQIGGQPRNKVAAINASSGNATSWDPDAGSSPARVRDLVVAGSNVYVGGDFTHIGGQTRHYIAAINTGTGLATNWDPNANSEVEAVAVDGPRVYAGGGFTSIGGQPRNKIAALDTTTGSATNWDPNAPATVEDLAVVGQTVYAGGDFVNVGGESHPSLVAIAASSGAPLSWHPGIHNGIVHALAANDAGDLFVGGFFRSFDLAAQQNFGAFETPRRSLGVSVEGSGAGTVSSTPAGIDCPATCSHRFPSSASVTLSATAAPGSTFTGWSGACSGTDPCQVDMSGDASVFASFEETEPANTLLPTISGTPVAGHTLTCAKGSWSGGTPQSYSYKWLRAGTAISDATTTTYVVKPTDAGKHIRCRVRATNNVGSATATSAAMLIKSPPKNTVAPEITGAPKVGKTLACSKGTWSGSIPMTYRYEWLRGGSPIAGATAATYVAKAADKNRLVSCKATAHNVAGNRSKTSAAVKVT